MESKARRLLKRLEKQARHGFRGDPIGTVAFYGPDHRRATKVVVGFGRGGGISDLQKWLVDAGDVRDDDGIMQSVTDCLVARGAASIVVTPGIYGCPHEEGIDYPDGGVCPACPFWADHDRGAIFRT
jgi:hypothetical protein